MFFCGAVHERLSHVSGLKPTPGPPGRPVSQKSCRDGRGLSSGSADGEEQVRGARTSLSILQGFQVQVPASSLSSWSGWRVPAATRWSGSKFKPQGSFQQLLQPLAGVTGNPTPLPDLLSLCVCFPRDRTKRVKAWLQGGEPVSPACWWRCCWWRCYCPVSPVMTPSNWA